MRFKNKYILFISIKTFDYERHILNKLIELGSKVTYFDERPSNSILIKGLIRINKDLISIKINLSQTDYLLPRSSFLQFKAYASSTDTTAHFKNHIASMIRRVRITVGGRDLELIDRYDQLHQMLELCSDDSTYDNVETYAINTWATGAPAAAITRDHNVGSRKWTEGVGSSEERIAWKGERTYTLKLYSGFLQMNKLMDYFDLLQQENFQKYMVNLFLQLNLQSYLK